MGPKAGPVRWEFEGTLDLKRLTTLERAFALARTGSCHTVTDIRAQLKKEQFDLVDAHLGGMSIQRQLNKLMKTGALQQTQAASSTPL